MVSLWGSKNQEDDEDGRGEDGNQTEPPQASASRRSEERVTERTHLLPPREGRNDYLDPDDPAVCPSLTAASDLILTEFR